VAQVTVVIPNWNGAHFLPECLSSLAAQTVSADVVVVDGASSDGSAALVRERFPEVTVVELPVNRGFAAAVNAGISCALGRGSEYVALLNNDAVAAPDWLAQLVACAREHPETGTVASKLLRDDRERIDSTGDFYSSWGWAYPRGRDELDRGQYDEVREVFCGSGGASLYRATMLREVGPFDEAYFAYYEDQDLGFRAQLMGWKARYEPTAVAYHRMMGTSGTIADFDRYHMLRNCIYLYVKNMPAPLHLKYLPKFLLALLLMAANDVRRRRLHRVLGAYREAMGHFPELLRERRRVQASRRVPVDYIDSILVHPLPPTQKRLLRIRDALTLQRHGVA
jgi:GT2 family glycosyltransferase